LRQYQPPTPDPIDIQIQEVVIKPQVQRPPIHVYVGPGQNREALRTPSPILIKSVPPKSPPTPPSQSIVYNKYVPIDYNPPPQQVGDIITIQIIQFFFIIRSSYIVFLKCHQNHVSYNDQYSLLIILSFFFLNIKRTYCC
jgi:hypothetical protein